MQDYKTMISMCAEQEEKFQFEHFSREDALKIGSSCMKTRRSSRLRLKFTVNGLVVFRYFRRRRKSRTASCGSRASAMRLT